MRIFIAALIPEEIKLKMKRYVDEIKPFWGGVKWEGYEKLHVTLKFLGEVEESEVNKIEKVVEKIVKSDSPFNMEVARFGGFPNLRNPRVLFIGLSQNEGLAKLQGEIEEELGALGFKKENRPFLPHITIGRIKGKSKLTGSLPVPERLPFFVSEIAVMRSVLRPEGSKYTPVSVFRLLNHETRL